MPQTTMRAQWKCRGYGKRGKPKAGFPLFPRAPWKSRQQQARFPHSHSADDEGDGKVENQKQVSHFPTAPNSSLSKQRTNNSGGFAPPKSTKGDFRQHPPGPAFRLIPCWNEIPISGSPRTRINSRFQAHFWIGKCCTLRWPCQEQSRSR